MLRHMQQVVFMAAVCCFQRAGMQTPQPAAEAVITSSTMSLFLQSACMQTAAESQPAADGTFISDTMHRHIQGPWWQNLTPSLS